MRIWSFFISAAVCGLTAGAVLAQDAGGPQVTIAAGEPATVLAVESSIWIDADPQRVWDAAVEELDAWWPHCYKSGSQIVLEPWVGGRVYEKFDESGQGGLYGQVLYIEEPVVIKLDGQWALPGAAVSGGTWRFEAQDGGTLFKTKGEIMGKLDAGNLSGREEGTKGVLRALKSYIEEGTTAKR